MMKSICLILGMGLCLVGVSLISASAQTYMELLSFDGNTAAGPQTPLTQGIDGSLYGTTYYGGTGNCFDGSGIGCGVVFKLTRNGQFQVLHNFQMSDGVIYPLNNLVLADDGNFYGANPWGGAVFRVTSSGTVTILHKFTGGPGGNGVGGGVSRA